MAKVGDRIGPYVLVDKLGRGAFGVVWLAEKRGAILTSQVALKMPNDEDVDLEAVKREAEVWKLAAGHANVLPIIDADVYDGQVVFVSEYAPDGSLAEWLEGHGGKAPSVGDAARMVEGILAGLEHLHSRNIIHRDLKPANILLQGETPRLADFGIARVIKTTNSYSVTVSGTSHYMAPEVYKGKRTEQTDLWAVGVILYQLLAGSLPFQGVDLHSLMYAVLTEQPAPLPASIPVWLRSLVAKSLEKDEGRRFRTAREMRRAMTQASMVSRSEELPPTITDLPPAEPQTPPTREQGWDEYSFFAEAGKRLKPYELEAVRRLYDYSIKSARVTWGSGAKKGTFNAKFDHVNSKSVYSVATNGDLYLNFAWLSDSAAGAEAVRQLGQKLRRLRGFNLPDNYPEKYVTVPTARWIDQVDEFTGIIDDVVRPYRDGQGSVAEEDEEETVVKQHAGHAVEFISDDEAYLRWLDENPGGYVVNTHRSVNPNYMVLHKATCGMIKSTQGIPPGGYTERNYIKICSPVIEGLQTWVGQHGRPDGSFSSACKACHPEGRSYSPTSQRGGEPAGEDFAKVEEPVVAININRQYPRAAGDPKELYQVTRSMWRLNIERANRARYAFAVYQGVIKEVYEVEQWMPATEATRRFWRERENLQGEDFGETHDGRSEFIGEVAPQEIRKKYVGKKLPGRPSQNPIRYFNC
jgi:serine/threonine protein kinase